MGLNSMESEFVDLLQKFDRVHLSAGEVFAICEFGESLNAFEWHSLVGKCGNGLFELVDEKDGIEHPRQLSDFDYEGRKFRFLKEGGDCPPVVCRPVSSGQNDEESE